MTTDRLGHLARLRRPAAVIGWAALLYAIATFPLTAINFDESWRRPFEGMTIWLVALLFMAFPLAGLSTILAARMERAATGLRHPMRAGWAGVALGVFLTAHWLFHMMWTPAMFLQAMTSSYRREDHLVGAFVALVAWGFAIAGVFIARHTMKRLRARSWDDATADEKPRTLPRIPTPWLGAIVYGLALLPLSAGFGAFAVDEHLPLFAPFLWGMAGMFAAAAGAAWGAWAYEGLSHGREPTRLGPRFVELFGTAWTAHWLPFWFMAASPMWSDYHHGDQLVASLVSAMLITVGIGAWSYGRAARLSVA